MARKVLNKNMNKSEWIKKETEQWVQEGLITPEQKQQIHMRYPVNKTDSPLPLFFAIVGSLLIGAGIILIFATNWWKLPIIIKITLAFLPLLASQVLCLYTFKRKAYSHSFKEGGAVLLSLSFFAALALIGQIFHTSSNLELYLLECILFSLPIIYLFRAKAALAIYIAGAIYITWLLPIGISIILIVLILPFFYLELKDSKHRGLLNYLLLLLSFMLSNTMMMVIYNEATTLETALSCGLVLLLLDALFRRIGSVYFFTSTKLMAILWTSITMLIVALDFSYSEPSSLLGIACAIIMIVIYIAIRCSTFQGVSSSDLIAASIFLLTVSAQIAGIMANLLLMALGVFHIVRGSKRLMLRDINYGMMMVILIITIRFFDSDLNLLGRGIVFILLGTTFLGINAIIYRKRKESLK